jgi:NDP-sugar pyrophosphorylase family protein
LKAAILAGGAGTRLYPITAYVPKALIPIGGKFVIEYIINYLKRSGVEHLVMLLSQSEYDLFRNHLGNGERYAITMEYSVSERIGTGGALGAAASQLDDRTIVYYGDVLTDMDLKAMLDFHASKESACTLAMSTAVPIEYGLGRVADDGRVTYFEEKPVLKEYPVSMGIYVVEKEVLSYCQPNTDLSRDIIPRLMREHKPVFAYLTDHRHYDIGTFKNLEEARAIVEQTNSASEIQ